MASYERLQSLCEAAGVSGQEDEVREKILAMIRPVCDTVTVTPLGGILAEKRGQNRPKHRLMIDAHMDEVGLIITHIDDEGFLSFGCVGGIDRRVLPGKRVWIGSNRVPGSVIVRPIHLTGREESGKAPSPDALVIDIGAKDRSEAMTAVQLGDTAIFDSFFEAGQGHIMGRALDDRAGCAALIHLLEQDLPYDITASFSVQEEVGLIGAATAAFAAKPDFALVLEATTAADIPGVAPNRQVCKVGQGPVLSFMDRSTVYDPALLRFAGELAQKEAIEIQYKQAVAGGNNAGSIHRSRAGVRTLALSLACRYLHAPMALISEQDYAGYEKLALALAGTLPALELT